MKTYSREDIESEIHRLSLDLSAFNERQYKQLVASALMKSVYEPLADAVMKCYDEQQRLSAAATANQND